MSDLAKAAKDFESHLGSTQAQVDRDAKEEADTLGLWLSKRHGAGVLRDHGVRKAVADLAYAVASWWSS